MALTKVTGNGLGAFTQDGAAVFNESSADTDFRIESNGNANMLVVDAGTDKIGIGTAAPTVTLEVANASNPALSGVTNRNPIIQLTNTDTGYVAGNATAIDFATSLNYTNASIICKNFNSGSGYGGELIFATATTGNSLAQRMVISSDGEITKPSQPAFLVKPSSQQSNVTGDTNVTVVMDNEIFDVGSNFSSNSFTAPITGKYFLSFVLYGVALPGTANYLEIAITTSNRGYVNIQEPSGSEDVYAGGTVSCIADMDANDTAFARVTVGGSSSQFDIGTTSTFSGALIC